MYCELVVFKDTMFKNYLRAVVNWSKYIKISKMIYFRKTSFQGRNYWKPRNFYYVKHSEPLEFDD